MVIQVIIRLTLYLDQALIRGGQESGNGSISGIDNTVSIEFVNVSVNLRQGGVGVKKSEIFSTRGRDDGNSKLR